MHEHVRSGFESILRHVSAINKRFKNINASEDFMKNEDGMTLLDAIAIRLQAIGENVRKIKRLNPELLLKHPAIEWDKVILFRNLISHHYELLNDEIIFSICKNDLPVLENVVEII